jgi:hypothetical protein
MPYKANYLEQAEQPINWLRAFLSGVVGAILLALLLDIFNMLGITRFSLETYLGSMFPISEHRTHIWLIGALANSVVGGLFGIFYAYCFEYVFKASNVRLGTQLGFGHAILAAVALFPFFGMVHQQMHVAPFANFGFFGSGIDAATPILLLFGHLMFGSCMGLFYGPVRAARARARIFEPGESGLPGEPDVMAEEEDPVDSAFA